MHAGINMLGLSACYITMYVYAYIYIRTHTYAHKKYSNPSRIIANYFLPIKDSTSSSSSSSPLDMCS